jgi:hypothetical protein
MKSKRTERYEEQLRARPSTIDEPCMEFLGREIDLAKLWLDFHIEEYTTADMLKLAEMIIHAKNRR